MYREIKFRAWDGIRMTTSGIMFNTSTGELETPTIASISGNPIKYELMQFTGLTDKNGKEIYEGDLFVDWEIVNSIRQDDAEGDFISYYEVSYCDGQWVCHCIEENHKYSHEDLLVDLLLGSKQIEVIGNIYENPELL